MLSRTEQLAFCKTCTNRKIIDLSAQLQAFISWTEPMDVLFYGIAVYEGFKFSRVQLKAGDLVKLEDQARNHSTNKLYF